ncbi:MAG: CDP-alcohol phosphatidyltransferase family protein [Actinomycetota bacterium]|jgi:cardiolipin synthase|nr:CDP-alcohol phosphatidyltransferase family protein [Acidimicrobiales bacterium]MED5229966.1 CDP-alcohol phosphatidyltransferase family protein [Actinomycetota bacterium]MED5445529.1 CDP-alcohol phosphatidyltransferase family protein [Actinomycetota bacterium]|tara:strand:+ start:1227 stop:1832 length:606 start_codon:yes stop_codon:yes gene_type:complete
MEEPNQTHERWRDNAFTVPNLISILRLAAVPVFVWLLIGENRPLAAAALLGILGATDWVDGWIARRFNQVSELGKVLDPTADRIMFLVAVFTMIIDESVAVWFGILTLVREGVVAIAALILGALGARALKVTWVGKTSSFGLMFAFPLFLLSTAVDGGQSTTYEVIAYVIGVPSLALHYIAAFGYIPLAITALREEREEML